MSMCSSSLDTELRTELIVYGWSAALAMKCMEAWTYWEPPDLMLLYVALSKHLINCELGTGCSNYYFYNWNFQC